MSHEHLTADLLDGLKSAFAALAPATLGSFVAQIYERGLTWRDRVLGLTAGICTSYYVTLGLVAWFKLDQFVGQGVGFVLGMIAVRSTPRFIAAASDLAAALPGMAREGLTGMPALIRAWLAARKDPS